MTSTTLVQAVETSIAQLSDDDRVMWLRFSASRLIRRLNSHAVRWGSVRNEPFLAITFLERTMYGTIGPEWSVRQSGVGFSQRCTYALLGKVIIEGLRDWEEQTR